LALVASVKVLASGRGYRHPSVASRWAFLLGVTAISSALTIALYSFIAPMRFTFLWLAVVLSAIYGGIASGVIASLLTTIVSSLIVFAPIGSTMIGDPGDFARVGLYLATALMLSWAVGWRRETHLEAERLRHWLATSVSSLGEALIATDNQGRILMVNPPAERLTGLDREEALGRAASEVFQVFDPRTGERLPDPLMASLREEIPVDVAGRVEALEGDETVPVEGVAAPIRDVDGSILGGILIFRDVSAARRAEAELRASESRFRLMADSAPVFIWTAGPDSLFDFVNQTWLRFTGRTFRQEVGNGWAEGIHAEDIDRTMMIYLESFERRAQFEMEFRMRRYDGAYRWIFCRGTPRFGGDREFDGYIGSCIDITERKEAEEERERVTANLAEAAEVLAASNRSKDEFLATLSHELRTPLTAVLGWTHLLREGHLDHNAREAALETIERGARSQVRLVDDILDVSRIITGKLSVARDPVDLVASVETSVSSLRPWAAERRIELHLHLPSDAIVVEGDAERLRQIVSNLVTNAIKFSPVQSSVEIVLEAGEGMAILSVTDRGVGISTEFLPHVFDRFSQAEVGLTRSHGGLGLGLAIVRHLVELHGGRVSVHSDGPGQGARFEVRFPIAEPGAGLSLSPPSGSHSLAAASIMVVDDDPDTVGLLVAILTDAGAKPVAASSVHEALRIAGETHLDLILIAIALPDGDGYRLLRALRDGREFSTPIVALAENGSPEAEAEAIEAGFALYLRKPVNPGDLAATLVGVLLGGAAPASRPG
jgi:PAS domain S-box-containing protein